MTRQFASCIFRQVASVAEKARARHRAIFSSYRFDTFDQTFGSVLNAVFTASR